METISLMISVFIDIRPLSLDVDYIIEQVFDKYKGKINNT